MLHVELKDKTKPRKNQTKQINNFNKISEVWKKTSKFELIKNNAKF